MMTHVTFVVARPVAVAGALVLAACGGGEKPRDETAAALPEQRGPGATAGARVPSGIAEGTALPQMIALGDSIFHGQVAGGICQSCHGPDAKGTTLGPNLTDAEWLHGDGSYESIVGIVTTGVSAPKKYPGAMPPRGGAPLTDEQVRAVAAYVYSLSRH